LAAPGPYPAGRVDGELPGAGQAEPAPQFWHPDHAYAELVHMMEMGFVVSRESKLAAALIDRS
jgi:hypothetical protein